MIRIISASFLAETTYIADTLCGTKKIILKLKSNFKGWVGEKKTSLHLWFSLNKNIYHRFNNVILLSQNGTTQIDHLILSKFGIFIIETKNRNGWIYGSEDRQNWTQSFFHSKFTFQNPLRQTYRQKNCCNGFIPIG